MKCNCVECGGNEQGPKCVYIKRQSGDEFKLFYPCTGCGVAIVRPLWVEGNPYCRFCSTSCCGGGAG